VYTSGRIKAGRLAILFIKESSWQPRDRPCADSPEIERGVKLVRLF